MKVRSSRNIILSLFILLILSGFCLPSFSFQEETITANKNIYKRVVGGAAIGTDFVVVDNTTDLAKFQTGDTVLLIQMKGIEIRVTQDGFYGDIQDTKGSPGKYEFLIVSSTNIGTKTVYFKNNLFNNYDVKSDVQLIRIPSYYSAVVASQITCQPWDSVTKTGGVLSMIVGRTLRLANNITVSASGFKGGTPVKGNGICIETDVPNLNKHSYDTSFGNSGMKGEGLVSKAWIDFATQYPIYPGYAKGKGANFNAGGAGNGRFAGGAGGSNYGAGGRGGQENCASFYPNVGGKPIAASVINGGLFMGGGGGGSTYSGANTATAGGKGGGIIIILCNELDGNGFSIRSNGETVVGTATGTAGAGGGGAGGSIALYLEKFTSTSLTISANGGNGGNNGGTFGEGGGGGGGYITINIAPPANVTRTVSLGSRGTNIGAINSANGFAGTTNTTFVPILNGFLFNSIQSSKTGNLVDSVCSNNIPYKVLGTNPVGGSGSYTYLWQRKNDSGGSPVNIPASNVKDFTFASAEADTFFIRRIVKDNVTLLNDTSKWLKILVQPKILNNKVNIYSHITSLTDTICFNQDPALIDQALPDLVPPTTRNLLYIWQDSSQAATWGALLASTKKYDPPAGLQKTRWYRRTVISGRCTDSSAIVRFTVLDTISKNIITNRFDTICHGGTFANLIPDAGLGGGDNTYRYLWEYSITGAAGTWAKASGTATNSSYNPDESEAFFPGKVHYRRKVFSGSNNVCADSSKSAIRLDWSKISGNTISADEVICSGSTPAGITGLIPANGSGSYRFTWQDSSRLQSWTNIPGYIKVTGLNYSPPSLTDTTAYRRIAFSSKCIDTSIIVFKNVHKPITNFNVSLFSGVWDTTICNGSVPSRLNGFTPGASGGTGNPANNIYQWMTSSAKNGGYSDIGGATAENYQPGNLTNATSVPVYFYYKRKVANGMCSVTSDSAVAVRVLPKISNNTISPDQAVCYNTIPAIINGTALTGGAGGIPTWLWQQSTDGGTSWNSAAGTSSQQNYSPPALTIPTRYRRIIYSGPADCCKDTSNVRTISINPLPVGAITTATDTICEGAPGQAFNLQITGSTASPWNVVFRENSVSKPGVPVSAANSSVAINPVISGSTTDSLSFVYKLVSIRDANNCDAIVSGMTGSRKLVVYKVPAAGAGQDAGICGQEYTLNGTKNVGTGRWFYPGVPVVDSTANLPSFTVTVDSTLPGNQWKYKFLWKVSNWKCKSSDDAEIAFYRRTSIANAGTDRDIYSIDNVDTLHAVKPLIGNGKWTFPSGVTISNDTSLNAIVSRLKVGANTFDWVVSNGLCSSSDQVTLTVFEFIIPDAFSPNGDGINDEFEVKGLDMSVSEVTLRIVNSAGTEVFYATNTGGSTWASWNGNDSMNVPLPDGTYYYLLTYRSKRDTSLKPKQLSGFIILKRNKLN